MSKVRLIKDGKSVGGTKQEPRAQWATGKPRFEWWTADKLTANPLNHRRHPEAQRNALQEVLKRVGWAGAVVFNERTAHTLDGHARVEEALKQGAKTRVPVFIVDVPAEKEAEALATFDLLGQWAEADPEQFAKLTKEIKAEFDDLGGLDGVLSELEADFKAVEAELGGQEEAGGWWVKVECDSERDQEALFKRFQGDGREVKVLSL